MSTLLNLNDSNKEYYNTVMGNPVTVDNAIEDEIRDMTVIIEPAQSGSGDPSPTNIRPISGVSSVSVTRTGKNLFPVETQTFVQRGNVIYFTPPLPAGTYTLSANVTTSDTDSDVSLALFNGNIYKYLSRGTRDSKTFTANVPLRDVELFASQDYAKGNGDSATWSNIQLEAGGIATDYEAPNPQQTVTVQLTDGSNPLTVYGGTLNVTTGKLTVTHALVELQTLTVSKLSATAGYEHNFVLIKNSDPSSGGSPETWICSHYTRSNVDWLQMPSMSFKILTGNTLRIDICDGRYTEISDMNAFLTAQKQAGTPVQVLYPLAAPLTYQLAPKQLTTLLGYNTVFTSAAQVSLAYRFDPTNIAIPE